MGGDEIVNTQSSARTTAVMGLGRRALRLSIGQWMMIVAVAAVVFAAFGVNGAVGMVLVAFFVSASPPSPMIGWIGLFF